MQVQPLRKSSIGTRAAVAAAAVGLVVALAPTSVSSTVLGPGFRPDPQTMSGTAGGPVRATRHGVTPDGMCTGWIAQSPNHRFTLSQDFDFLAVSVTAPVDTTLVILGPDGARCQDDFDGFNPSVRGTWRAGDYSVYVGTYDGSQSVRYTMSITTRR